MLTDFETAKTSFLDLIQSIRTQSERVQFMDWIRNEVVPEFRDAEQLKFEESLVDGRQRLHEISAKIRTMIPERFVGFKTIL